MCQTQRSHWKSFSPLHYGSLEVNHPNSSILLFQESLIFHPVTEIFIYIFTFMFLLYSKEPNILVFFCIKKKKHYSYPRSLNLLCKQISTQIGKEEHTHYAEGCCCCYFCLFFSKSMSQLRSLYIQQDTVLPPRAYTLARNDRHRSCYPLYR